MNDAKSLLTPCCNGKKNIDDETIARKVKGAVRRFVLLLLTFLLASAADAVSVKLTDGWKVQSAVHVNTSGAVLSTPAVTTEGWLPATVPSTLMGILIANGIEREALTAADYAQIDRRQFDVNWWYRTTFTLPRRQAGEHVLLSFDGISYRANIWLNGHQIANSQEVFGPYRQFSFDVTSFVGEQNVLAVEVFRAQPGEPNIGFADWNPRPADESMGIFREVTLKTCGSVSIAHTAVQSKVNKETLDEALLTINTIATNHSDREVRGTLRGILEGITYTANVTLAPYERRLVNLVVDEPVSHPRLWWCHNMGEPELYDLHVDFLEDRGVSDAEDIRFGIREIESFLTPEGYRSFRLNGRSVLLRGAGWTDEIYLRDTPASNRLQLQYVRDMNMNTVRFEGFWGNSQDLYECCDELGLLVLVGWSCHWEWEEYLGSPCSRPYGGITRPEDMELIGRSFEDQVLWLRRHPSIIAWFVGSDMIPMPELEVLYRQTLTTYDDRSYLISAKEMTSTLSGPSGTKMAGPYEYVSPAYWYSPEAPGGAFGFNTETGIGAQLPVKESLIKMLGPDLFPIDERWNILCTASSSDMNSLTKLTEVIDGRFGKSRDIDQYLRRADLLNYESTRAMFEAFRLNIPHSTGIIQWMLNGARPGIYWQLYDYYKQPNAAYYALKRGNAPIQLIYDYQRHIVCAVNETLEPVTIRAKMQLAALKGMLQQQETSLTIYPNKPVKVFDVQPLDAPATFLFLKAAANDGQQLTANEYFLPDGKDQYLWEKSYWVGTPIAHYASYQGLDSLPEVNCQASVRRIKTDSHHYQLTLTNPSPSVAFMIRLSVKDADGNLVCPAFWSDNYVTLAPAEQRTISCTLPEMPRQAEVHFAIEGWNVKRKTL